ncbi:TPA: hypothetical protein ACYU8D_004510 [Klebsiella pneumoniae]|uniref:hypothetical protein n=1 Tax=Klebsiella pneumoniae TaxID=573 RepID=UPI0006698001|nr:hypothetical protein [Klebsiella pneumoniae]AVG05630.1 hypothetical protein AL516_14715 [Klebsiella pneumoniae]EIV3903990.1 hypothetical protein [Klebsiella pneumoniae]EIV3932084.1 hypothetical protein [Klebsiella pneumoniae]EIW8542083.1 hypothetical protein [Klebsiella pneumoniae]EIW8782830.1 hypothetical protein [Klebsiella pneumoniae]
MELASLVRDILRQRHVERLAQHREQDNEAEAEWEIARWRHRSGVVIQRRYELESAQQDSASCPECWIDWQVIDAAGQEVNPMRKQFYNLCQQSFWLAMQAGGEDETSDRIAQITDNHP